MAAVETAAKKITVRLHCLKAMMAAVETAAKIVIRLHYRKAMEMTALVIIVRKNVSMNG